MKPQRTAVLLSNGSHGVMITSVGAGYGTGRGVTSVELDGQRLPNDTVPLSDDGKNHNVSVELG
jgi:phosphatidate phosphatase PAH1